jgi:hypothetical protein
MQQLSDSLAKTSDQMSRLSKRTKEAEEHAAAARTETREQIEGRISTVKADAQRQRDEARTRGTQAKDDAGAEWSKLRTSVSDHLDEMRAKIDQQRDDHDADVAARRADQAEQNAADSIDFATWAVAEGEASVLEATEARMIADSLA